MSCLGVHFAVSNDDLQRIVSAPDDEALLNLIKEDIEETYLKLFLSGSGTFAFGGGNYRFLAR